MDIRNITGFAGDCMVNYGVSWGFLFANYELLMNMLSSFNLRDWINS
jgi:hypothetical protein